MSRHGENIRKRKDGRWEARLLCENSTTGGTRYKSFYGRTYREAKEKLMNAVATNETSIDRKTEIKLRDVLNFWIEHNQPYWKESTTNKYMDLIENHILPTLGSCEISSLSSMTINNFILQKCTCGRLDGTGGLSVSQVRVIAVVLCSAIKTAVDFELCLINIPKIHMPRQKKTEVKVLTEAEQRRLECHLLSSDNPNSLGILLALRLGMRLGEVCALTWQNVDMDNRVLRVEYTLSRVKNTDDGKSTTKWILEKPKTAASFRNIPIPSDVAEILKKAKCYSTSKFVISKNSGFLNPRTLEYQFQKMLTDCGIQHYKFHALRHTFATRCIEFGVDVKSLSEILGHANVSVTMNTYVHPSFELKRAQLEKLTSLSA